MDTLELSELDPKEVVAINGGFYRLISLYLADILINYRDHAAAFGAGYRAAIK